MNDKSNKSDNSDVSDKYDQNVVKNGYSKMKN